MGKPTAPEFESRPTGTMRLHPDMPRPNIPDDIPEDKWSGIDKTDYADKRFTYGFDQAHWDSIFGKKIGKSG
jgi:hypothetical protein